MAWYGELLELLDRKRVAYDRCLFPKTRLATVPYRLSILITFPRTLSRSVPT